MDHKELDMTEHATHTHTHTHTKTEEQLTQNTPSKGQSQDLGSELTHAEAQTLSPEQEVSKLQPKDEVCLLPASAVSCALVFISAPMAAFVLQWQSQLFTIRPFTEKVHQPLLKPQSPQLLSQNTLPTSEPP